MPSPLRLDRSLSRWAVVLIIAAVLFLSGCQARVVVDTTFEKDGSGVLAVALGLDEKAVAQIGDLDREVRLGDLTAAGWTVVPTTKAADGMTWMRASRPFTDIEDLNRSLADLTGPPAMFRDFRLEKDDSGTNVTYKASGVIDTTHGLDPFGDPQLAARLGGDAFGGRLAAAEETEGRPISEMVAFAVSGAFVDGSAQLVHPTLADSQPTTISFSLVEAKPATSLEGSAPVGVLALAGVLVVAMLAGARRKFAKAPALDEQTPPTRSAR